MKKILRSEKEEFSPEKSKTRIKISFLVLFCVTFGIAFAYVAIKNDAYQIKSQEISQYSAHEEIVENKKEISKEMNEDMNSKLRTTCFTEEEKDQVIEIAVSKNNKIAKETKYVNLQTGISIDLGKYGFTEGKDGKIYFGEWFCDCFCKANLTQLYELEFVEIKTKEEIINMVKKMEFDDGPDGFKLFSKDSSNKTLTKQEIKNIYVPEGVVIWEEWGGSPSSRLHFEVPGKLSNYRFSTDPLRNHHLQDDYRFILNVIGTIKLF